MRNYETLDSYMIIQSYQNDIVILNLKDYSKYDLNLKDNTFYIMYNYKDLIHSRVCKDTKFFILGESYELYWDELCYYN